MLESDLAAKVDQLVTEVAHLHSVITRLQEYLVGQPLQPGDTGGLNGALTEMRRRLDNLEAAKANAAVVDRNSQRLEVLEAARTEERTTRSRVVWAVLTPFLAAIGGGGAALLAARLIG